MGRNSDSTVFEKLFGWKVYKNIEFGMKKIMN